jgi:hypothetical protein
MREKGYARVEATAEAERGWTEHVHDAAQRMLFTHVDSWMMGINSNVPGKQKRTVVVYAGGAPKYREEVAAGGYVGFTSGRSRRWHDRRHPDQIANRAPAKSRGTAVPLGTVLDTARASHAVSRSSGSGLTLSAGPLGGNEGNGREGSPLCRLPSGRPLICRQIRRSTDALA